MTTKSKGIKGAFFLYKQFFFGNLFYLFSSGKIQFELWEEKDQRLNLVTPVYMNNDHLEALKKIQCDIKTPSSEVWRYRY